MYLHKEINFLENHLCIDICVCCIHTVTYLLCDEVISCIVLHVEVVRSLNLNFGQNDFNL
jgi:hypothetical protein